MLNNLWNVLCGSRIYTPRLLRGERWVVRPADNYQFHLYGLQRAA